MRTIYLNNMRGFTEEFINLGDINFFIGENSTGKTSVLKTIRSIYNQEFWSTGNLDLSKSDLGYFHEITNYDENRTFFEIGVFDPILDLGIKLKYVEDNGKPSISDVSFLNSYINIQFVNVRKEFKYRYKIVNKLDTTETLPSFSNWVKKNELGTEKFIELNEVKDKYNIGLPIFFKLFMRIGEIFKENGIKDTLVPFFGANLYWFAPIRSHPKRIYDDPNSIKNPDGSHTPFLLRDQLVMPNNDGQREKKKKMEFILNKFGTDSGLFDSVSINEYGSTITSPFQVQITINGKKLNFTNVGYGVSQILPLLVEIIVSPMNSVFSVQQPEVHLHPRGQAAFGDFIYKSFIEEKKTFLIETHSDYLIDRFRIRLSKSDSKIGNPNSQILFFTKGNNGNKVTSIKIHEDGKFDEDLPNEYRSFFIREQLELLNI